MQRVSGCLQEVATYERLLVFFVKKSGHIYFLERMYYMQLFIVGLIYVNPCCF